MIIHFVLDPEGKVKKIELNQQSARRSSRRPSSTARSRSSRASSSRRRRAAWKRPSTTRTTSTRDDAPSSPSAAASDARPRSAPARTPYSDLLSGTRALQREQRAEREAWLGALALDGQGRAAVRARGAAQGDGLLLESAQPPGPAAPLRRSWRRTFAPRSRSFATGSQRAIALARQLLGPLDRAFVFHRYLETVLPGGQRAQRACSRRARRRRRPKRAWSRCATGSPPLTRSSTACCALQRVPFRLFHALARHRLSRGRSQRLLQSAERARVSPRVRPHQVRAGARPDPQRAGRRGAPPGRAHVPLAVSHAALPRAARIASSTEAARAASRSAAPTWCSACCAPTRARSATTCASAPERCSPKASSAT